MTAKTLMLKLNALLDGDEVSEVGTWADEMRSNPSHFWQKEIAKSGTMLMSTRSLNFNPATLF